MSNEPTCRNPGGITSKMPRMRHIAVVHISLISGSVTAVAQDDWNTPHEPFRIFGETYYVGTTGLSAILITSNAGHILIDGGLPQSAPLIAANIRKLGFEPRDVQLILNSHEHFDHGGGLAALQRATGARVAASPAAARALRQGHPTPEDPQYGSGLKVRFDSIENVEAIADRTTLRIGPLAITAHFTPGHTPGATTWVWRSCEGRRCVDVVYADSLTPVSDDGFKFTGDATRPASVDAFRTSWPRGAAPMRRDPRAASCSHRFRRQDGAAQSGCGREPVHRAERMPHVCRGGAEQAGTTHRGRAEIVGTYTFRQSCRASRNSSRQQRRPNAVNQRCPSPRSWGGPPMGIASIRLWASRGRSADQAKRLDSVS